MASTPQRILFLPVEIKTREFEAKMLLAREALIRGYAVVIGAKRMRSLLRWLPEGAVLYKDSCAPMLEEFQAASALGHKIIVHDEEGLVQQNDEDYMDRRLRFPTIQYVDLYLCWGRHQLELLKRVAREAAARARAVSTGHPRVDLLREPIAVGRHGLEDRRSAILVNTKLGECNHRRGPGAWLDLLKSHGMVRSSEALELRHEQIKYKRKLFDAYVELMKVLSASFPESDIILRPHPTENEDVWTQLMAPLSNVRVEKRKPVHYWIQRSDVLIHTGCTTAIEAVILACPVVSFSPIHDPRFVIPLPESISYAADSIEAVVKAVEAALAPTSDAGLWAEEARGELDGHIENIVGEYAFRRIMDEVDALQLTAHRSVRLWRNRGVMAMRLWDVLRRLRNWRKFDSLHHISREEIRDSLDTVSAKLEPHGRVRIQEILRGVYLLQGEGK